MSYPRLKKISCAIAISATSAAWADYVIIDLGTLGSTFAAPSGINNYGEVVGVSRILANDNHAFFYSLNIGVMSDLHPSLNVGSWQSYATAINDSGLIAGSFGPAGGNGQSFILDRASGTVTNIGTLGGASAGVQGINSSGDAVGNSQILGSTDLHAFLYSNGVMTDLGGLPGYHYSIAQKINDNGDIVGNSWGGPPTSAGEAFLYSNNVMTSIGTLGGNYAWAMDINENGQIVGSSYISDNATEHAFLYQNGTMIDLDNFGGKSSFAYAINNNGDVVGVYYTAGPGIGVIHSFLYSNGVMQDLSNLLPAGSGWTLQSAVGINDSGMIIGTGIVSGEHHAFLMAPGC